MMSAVVSTAGVTWPFVANRAAHRLRHGRQKPRSAGTFLGLGCGALGGVWFHDIVDTGLGT
jgi:hypothetical protein